MKKLFYIFAVVTMFSLNANADSYLYLHHNYPNGDKEEVNDSIWVNGEVLNDWYYTDATKSERHFFKNDYEFPTCEGYEFVCFYDESKSFIKRVGAWKFMKIIYSRLKISTFMALGRR